MSLTVSHIKEKEAGDSISAFQGTIDKIWDYKEGENEIGKWSFQDVVLLDSAGQKITVKLTNRVQISRSAVAVYIQAQPDKKGKTKGAEVDVYNNIKRIKTTTAASIQVYINGAWQELDAIERKAKEDPTGHGSVIPSPQSKQPPMEEMPPHPAETMTPKQQEPLPAKVTGPKDPEPEKEDTTPQNEKVKKLPASQLIITKCACVKSAADIVCVLIAAGKIEATEQNVENKVRELSGAMYNCCLDIEESLPF